MIAAAQVQHLRKRWKEMEPVLNEQSRRRWAVTEAKALGRGGVSCVVRVTGLARRTVYRGLDDIRRRHKTDVRRIRKRGGGRKPKIAHDRTLLSDLKPLTRLRLRPTRCIGWHGWCKWSPVEPAGTCPGYKSSKLGGSEAPWTTGARDEHSAIGGGSLA